MTRKNSKKSTSQVKISAKEAQATMNSIFKDTPNVPGEMRICNGNGQTFSVNLDKEARKMEKMLKGMGFKF